MKFLHYIALIGGSMAVKLHQHSAIHLATPPQLTLIQSKAKEDGHGGPPAEFMHDFEAWGNDQLKEGEKTVTKQEAKEFVENWAKDRGIDLPDEAWEQLEMMFDLVDANGDGQINQAEVDAIMEEHKDVQWPTENEIIAWVEGELEKDGDITWKEIKKAMKDWAKSQNYEIPKEIWKAMKQGFNMIDADKDGKVVREELEAVFGNHEHSDHHTDHGDHHQNEGPSEEEVKAYLYGLIDANGHFTLEEILDAADKWAADNGLGGVPDEVKEDITKHFNQADKNGDGKVDREELDQAFA